MLEVERRGGYQGGVKDGKHPWLDVERKITYTEQEKVARTKYLNGFKEKLKGFISTMREPSARYA
jgi:hypothetical protein